jgi:broad specificity phosphatase PhoE
MNKTLHLIRHGLALHNEKFLEMGMNVNAFRLPEVTDAPLIEEGHYQSINLGNNWTEKYNIELVIVSPLMRTLETAVNIFGDTDIPIISKEFLREYPVGRDTCNKRSDISLLKNKFPGISFEIKENRDIYWHKDEKDMETMMELDQRIEEMKKFILQREENNIAIVSHSSYLGQFKDNYISLMENGDTELKHCYPYKYELKYD